MRLPRLAGVVLAAAAPAWGQVSDLKTSEPRSPTEANSKELPSKPGGGAKGEPLDADAAAELKKKFISCKKTGDCKPYLLEKEKIKKKKPILDAEPAPAPVKPSAPPAAGRPREDAPVAEAAAGAPPEVRAPSSAEAMGEVSAAPPPSAERTESMRQEAGQRRELTWSRAAGAADTMRRSFLPADGTAGPKPGGPPAEEARRDSPSTEPWSVQEMALAASKGYAATFRDQGLKVGAGPRGEPAVLRADGEAASPADLSRLRAALSAEPAAPRRRPDFFEVLPRERFADLKRDFAARPELRATVFRDIGMTAGQRDFQWSATCSGLSGGCNPLAGQGSYRKGQDVPPEDLDAVWDAAQEDIFSEDAEEDDGWGEYTEEERRLAAEADLAEEMLSAGRARGPNLGSLLARMGDLARDVGEAAGWAPAAAGAPGDGVSGPVRERTSGSSASGPGTAAPKTASSTVPVAPPAPEGRTAAGRGWLYVLAAAVSLLVLAGLRRRQRS